MSPDGQTFLTIGPRPDPRSSRAAYLVPAAGGKPRAVTEGREVVYDGQFSPAGMKLLMCGIRTGADAGAAPGGGAGVPPVNPGFDRWLESTTVEARDTSPAPSPPFERVPDSERPINETAFHLRPPTGALA